MAPKYDLLVKGGEVIDPAQGIHAVQDVAFTDGKVAAIAAGIPASDATEVYDATGMLVTPGLVDIHEHFYYGVKSICVDPRKDILPTGVTCAADGGTAGSKNYYNLRDLIIKPSALHLYEFLHIAELGQLGGNGLRTLDMANVESAVRIIERNRDTIVGVKVQLPGPNSPFASDAVELLKRAVEAGERSGTPVLCHIAGGIEMGTLFEILRPGDIVTHCFASDEPTFIENGKVRPEVWAGVKKGVRLDISPAGNSSHFGWTVAETCAREGLWPDIIGTDLANPNKARNDVMHHVPDCISMMMSLGMPLDLAIAAATTNPANAMGKGDLHGSLRIGDCGDAAVLRRERGQFDYMASGREIRTIDARLAPIATINQGTLAWTAAAQHVGATA